jgi:undecaprenyl pyrophosphate phosphatase UppP
MTIAAAQARGFSREAAWELSREIAIPIVAGAATLKIARLRRTPVRPELRASFGAGALAATISARAARPLAHSRPALPFAAERVALAVAVLWKDRRR